MKHKMKENLSIPDGGILLNACSGEFFQATEPGVMVKEKVRKNHSRSRLEEFILAEFDIDSETMDEHLDELLHYMMHQQLIDKMPHN